MKDDAPRSLVLYEARKVRRPIGWRAARALVAVTVVAAVAVYLHTRGETPALPLPNRQPSHEEDDKLARAAPLTPVKFAQETCREHDEVATGCQLTAVPPAPARSTTKRVHRVRTGREHTARAASPHALDPSRAESRMLAQARAQLRAGDLGGAEQTLHRAREKFAQGSLGQEREVLQIELLAALGDREGADHRTRRFLRKHPDSLHAARVQQFLIAP